MRRAKKLVGEGVPRKIAMARAWKEQEAAPIAEQRPARRPRLAPAAGRRRRRPAPLRRGARRHRDRRQTPCRNGLRRRQSRRRRCNPPRRSYRSPAVRPPPHHRGAARVRWRLPLTDEHARARALSEHRRPTRNLTKAPLSRYIGTVARLTPTEV